MQALEAGSAAHGNSDPPSRARSATRPRVTAVAPGVARRFLVTVGILSLLLPASTSADETVVVSNETHEIRVVRVAKTDSLHKGMVQPPTADEAFLLVRLETDDPCFDPAQNAECFDGERDELEITAWACGEVVIGEDDVRPADGGGLLDGELACSYLIPIDAKGLTLRLRGYPEITVEPTD